MLYFIIHYIFILYSGVFDVARPDGSTYTVCHWFDGMGVLHRFRIENGKVETKKNEVFFLFFFLK
jgi:hypothetical protein